MFKTLCNESCPTPEVMKSGGRKTAIDADFRCQAELI